MICIFWEQICAFTQSENEDPVALSVCLGHWTQKLAASTRGGRHHRRKSHQMGNDVPPWFPRYVNLGRGQGMSRINLLLSAGKLKLHRAALLDLWNFQFAIGWKQFYPANADPSSTSRKRGATNHYIYVTLRILHDYM